MDSSFVSTTNLNNVYQYINAEMVNNHNINLDNDSKNKKIVKKLTKTVFDKINNDMRVSNKKVTIPVNTFNDMVKKKCVPFLLNKISEDSLKRASLGSNRLMQDTHSKRKRKYSVKKQKGINIAVEPKFVLNDTKKNDDQYQSFITNSIEFDKIVKESNKKINDTFNAYSENEDIFNSHNNISDNFTINRCSLRDDVKNKKLDANAFNDALSKKIEINEDIDNKDKKNNDVNMPPMQAKSAYNSYNELNVRDLLDKVAINQKDHSSNQLESYEGELYLPNLIKEIGEEAPIQPLLYQNTTQGYERLDTRSLIIDSGDAGGTYGNLDLTSEGTPKAVTNLGSNRWHKIRVNLQETFKVDKLCDIYVKNFTLIGATDVTKCLYFSFSIEEFNILKPSNNKHIKDKLIFINTNTETSPTKKTDIVTQNFQSRSNFVATTNPQTFYNLNINLTNENNNHADETIKVTDPVTNGHTFKDHTAKTNRFIIELEFVPRPKQNDIIFDRTPYGSALNAELSNT